MAVTICHSCIWSCCKPLLLTDSSHVHSIEAPLMIKTVVSFAFLAQLPCREGLQLAEDGRKCVDVNECAEGTAHCEQQCINNDPRRSGVPFSCACNLGFSLNPEDQSSCIKTVNSLLIPVAVV